MDIAALVLSLTSIAAMAGGAAYGYKKYREIERHIPALAQAVFVRVVSSEEDKARLRSCSIDLWLCLRSLYGWPYRYDVDGMVPVQPAVVAAMPAHPRAMRDAGDDPALLGCMTTLLALAPGTHSAICFVQRAMHPATLACLGANIAAVRPSPPVILAVLGNDHHWSTAVISAGAARAARACTRVTLKPGPRGERVSLLLVLSAALLDGGASVAQVESWSEWAEVQLVHTLGASPEMIVAALNEVGLDGRPAVGVAFDREELPGTAAVVGASLHCHPGLKFMALN